MKDDKEDLIEDLNADLGDQNQETNDEKAKPKSMTSTRNGLYLRLVIGAMIVYYAYSSVSNIAETVIGKRVPIYIIAAVLAVAGIVVVIQSIIKLVKKDYDNN